MTFAMLVQSKAPVRYLGAPIQRVRHAMYHYALLVELAGAPEPFLVSMEDLYRHGLRLQDVPRLTPEYA